MLLTKKKKIFQLNIENYSNHILDIWFLDFAVNWKKKKKGIHFKQLRMKMMPELQISQQKSFNCFQQVLFMHHLLKLAKYCTIQREKTAFNSVSQ